MTLMCQDILRDYVKLRDSVQLRDYVYISLYIKDLYIWLNVKPGT